MSKDKPPREATAAERKIIGDVMMKTLKALGVDPNAAVDPKLEKLLEEHLANYVAIIDAIAEIEAEEY